MAQRIGSGTVIALGLLVSLVSLATLGQVTGWDPTWRSIGVTPLHPFFFDIHVPLDYAACAAKGVDPYVPHACNVANFNIPPIWLWIGRVGLYGSAFLLAAVLIAAAAIMLILLLKGRGPIDGAVALVAILSPSVFMGIERANPDLLILTLVGSTALVYDEKKNAVRLYASIVLSAIATVLKLFPFFTVALAFRLSRRSLFFGITLGAISIVYFAAIFPYLILIRRNVPTTYILSYGYQAIFLGLDHLRAEAGLPFTGLNDTWFPIFVAGSAVVLALIVALINVRDAERIFKPSDNTAGTAFFFGSAIYSGTFLLGTNFIYRLSFLLLCLPQLLDWKKQQAETKMPNAMVQRMLLPLTLAVLWANGDSNGHTTFHLIPQIFNWLLFFALTSALLCQLFMSLNVQIGPRQAGADSRTR